MFPTRDTLHQLDSVCLQAPRAKTQERLPQDVLCLKDMNNLSLQAWTLQHNYSRTKPCEDLKGYS